MRASTQPDALQPILPVLYECMWEITGVAEKFPNVFFDSPAVSVVDRFGRLRPPPAPRQGTVNLAAATTAKGVTQTNISLSVFMRPKLLSAEEAQDDTDRIVLSFICCHYETVNTIGPVSLWVVDDQGRRTYAPKLIAFNEHTAGINSGNAVGRGVEWRLRLVDLWEDKANLFPDDKLRIKVRIGHDYSQSYSALPNSLNTLACNMLDVLESGEGSDFTITCGSQEFKVHELILAIRSPVFKAMLSHAMQEKTKREVKITDIEPDTLKVLLQFVYSSKVEPANFESHEIYELIQAADKYQITELKNICFNYVSREINFDNIGDLATLAYRHSATEQVQKRVRDFVVQNFKTLVTMPELKKVMKECTDMIWEPVQVGEVKALAE